MSVFLPGFLCLEFLPRDPFIINRALKKHTTEFRASQVALVVKNLPANAGDVKAIALIPGSGRPPGVKHGKRVRHNWSDLVCTHETEFNMQRFTSPNFSKYFITQIHINIQYKCISKILFSLKKKSRYWQSSCYIRTLASFTQRMLEEFTWMLGFSTICLLILLFFLKEYI